MGYYSTFTVDVCNPKTVCLADEETIRTVIKQLRESCDYADLCLGDMGESIGTAKWYDFKEDLCNFTKDRTDIILVVYRIGESDGDLEKIYFFNGKYQQEKAIITYHPFNPEKLRKPKE